MRRRKSRRRLCGCWSGEAGHFSYPENGIKIHKRQFFFRGNHGIITLSAGLLQRMMFIWAGADNTIQEGQ